MISLYELVLEQSYYIGIVLVWILYGIYLVIYALSIYFLHKTPKTTSQQRIFYVIYSSILLLLNTSSYATQTLLGQMMWIVHRDGPGGPQEYYDKNAFDVWFTVFGNTAQGIANFLTDALLIYRCYIIFGSQIRVILFPAACLTAFLVVSLIEAFLVKASVVANTPAAHHLLVFNTVTIALTTTTNIAVTAMISIRLWLIYRATYEDLGTQMASTYKNVLSIFIESALPWTALGIAVCAVTPNADPVWNAVSLTWSAFGGISPQLIILRIAMGTAWNKDSMTGPITDPSTLVFASHRIAGNPEHNGDARFFLKDERLDFSTWRTAMVTRGTGVSNLRGEELTPRHTSGKDERRRYSVGGLYDLFDEKPLVFLRSVPKRYTNNQQYKPLEIFSTPL